MIKLIDIINERKLMKTTATFSLSFDLNSSIHSDERKFRHLSEITDNEIIKTVESAFEEITNLLIFDDIDIGDEICIANLKTNLNVVCGITEGSNNNVVLTLITVIRKYNFKPYSGTFLIEI